MYSGTQNMIIPKIMVLNSLAQCLEIIYIWLLINFLNIPFFYFVIVCRHGADF